jgi:pyruvate/2-oxoglutarate dehydrogenase complex dihydrolipoamide acyltransferase (E2) component
MTSSPTDLRGRVVELVMPQMGTSVTEGTIIGWSKKIGDVVVEGDVVCEISTDKVDSDCPAPADGTLVEILVGIGETVEVGTVLARIRDGDGAGEPPAVEPRPAAPAAQPGPSGGNGPPGRRYSPIVARMAAEHGLDLATIPGTGRGDRVTKRDVLAFMEQSQAERERPLHSESPYRPDPVAAESPVTSRVAANGVPPVPEPQRGRVEPLSRMRRAIAAAMLRSQQTTATAHTVVECDMTEIETERKRLGLTALPLLARAVIEVLRDHPDLNATLEGETMTRYTSIHIGIAVSLGRDGLIVPVIHDAQNLSVEGLAARIRELARRARENALTPADVGGATFTLTSPGAAGAMLATPIINAPQVAILDFEAVTRRPVVVRDPSGAEAIGIRSMSHLILGWDHRAVDGIYAAQFLTALRGRLELSASTGHRNPS